MNTLYKKVLLLSCGVISLFSSSCKEQEIPFYDQQYNAVRFPQKGEDNKEPIGYDEVNKVFVANHTFIKVANDAVYDYKLPIELIGLVAEQDRKVSVSIDKTRTNAPEDSYEIGEALIPKGKREGHIMIKLKNSVALQSSVNSLVLKLESSSNLVQGPENLIYALVSWSQMIPVPVHPNHIQTYNTLIKGESSGTSTSLDHFSPRALRFIVETLGWDNWDDMKIHGKVNFNGPDYLKYKYLPRIDVISKGQKYKAYAQKLKEALKEYNIAHPGEPMLHDAGELKGQAIEIRL